MDRSKIIAAMTEARRFLDRCDAALEELSGEDGWVTGTKHSGALRRSSMDLSRALAELRGRAL